MACLLSTSKPKPHTASPAIARKSARLTANRTPRLPPPPTNAQRRHTPPETAPGRHAHRRRHPNHPKRLQRPHSAPEHPRQHPNRTATAPSLPACRRQQLNPQACCRIARYQRHPPPPATPTSPPQTTRPSAIATAPPAPVSAAPTTAQRRCCTRQTRPASPRHPSRQQPCQSACYAVTLGVPAHQPDSPQQHLPGILTGIRRNRQNAAK